MIIPLSAEVHTSDAMFGHSMSVIINSNTRQVVYIFAP
jgi:hypothetical protein